MTRTPLKFIFSAGLLPLFFAAFFADACPAFARPLSFEAARSMLRENSDGMKAAAALSESKSEEAKALDWLHGPTIGVQGMEVWGQTRIDLDRSVPTPFGSLPVRIEEDYNFSGPRASFTGTLPIFSGGKIPAAQKAAKYAAEEAKAEEKNVGIGLDCELIARYFGLQLAASIRRLRDATLEQQNRELEKAVKFEREGMISPVERMGAEVARDAAKRQSVTARDDERIAKIRLQRLLQSENAAELTTPLFVLKKPLAGMEEWTKRALAANPRISVMDARVKQAEQGVEASRSAFMPQIFAFGEYSLIRHYLTPIEPTMMAGVGAGLTLWDARDRTAGLKSAKAASRAARSGRADAANQVRAAVESAWISTGNARESYELTASDAALARENLRLKTKGFYEGLYTALDVTEARDQLLKAEVGRRVAAYEFVVNYAMLHALSGDMDGFMQAINDKDAIFEK